MDRHRNVDAASTAELLLDTAAACWLGVREDCAFRTILSKAPHRADGYNVPIGKGYVDPRSIPIVG